jgi:predicted acyl esterase
LDIVEETVAIPVSAGRTLHARLWRPKEGRHPAVLDSSPYRVSDLFAPLMESQLPVYAQGGYAALAIDVSGAGNSTGLLLDEYLMQEIGDLVEAIAWAAGQDWCDGQVALSGLSWAAFAALRAAAHKPPALKAMALGGVSEDGWRTDIHYLGGALYTGHIDWAGVMLMFNALPPDPAVFKGDWRAEWKARLEANRPWLVDWLQHQRHDAYWTDKAAPLDGETPLLLYGGLADKYATSVLRIASAWRGPVRTIIGPWEHAPPDIATRGPRIGFLSEAIRWFDHHLKGAGNSAMTEAPLRLWIGTPDGERQLAAGAWHAVNALGEGPPIELRDGTPEWQRLMNSPPSSFELPADLYEDVPSSFDGGALSRANAYFLTGDRQDADIDIAGTAVVRLRARVKGRGGQIIARLGECGTDGSWTRMTTGAVCVAEGDDVEVMLPLQATAWRLRKGRHLELILCADGWPTFWPAPGEPEVFVRDVRLSIPTLGPAYRPDPAFGPPQTAPATPRQKLKWIDPQREEIAWPPHENAAAHDATTAAHHLPATGTDYFIASRFEVAHDDGQGWAAKSYRVAFERPGWSIRIDVQLEVTSTEKSFEIAWTINAEENDQPFHYEARYASVPRDTV